MKRQFATDDNKTDADSLLILPLGCQARREAQGMETHAKRETMTTGMKYYDEPMFSVYHEVPDPPLGHMHDTIEISVFEHGNVTMLYGGRAITIPPNHLIVNWGILPHRVLNHDSRAQVVGIHVPLTWLLQWNLPQLFLSRLLDLEVLIDTPQTDPCSDLELLRFWVKTVRDRGEAGRDIVLLSARSRLLQLALDHSVINAPTLPDTGQPIAPGLFEHAVEFIAAHFCEPIQIKDVAQAVGVTPRHLSRIFRQISDHSLNEYITQLRLSNAQRLLVTTDCKIIDIMYESGFRSQAWFYRIFQQQAGCSPSHYRRAHHGTMISER